MTNEERHIAVLNRMLENMDVYDSIQPTTERKKAIKAAIKALEQQPCDDAVSRADFEAHLFENYCVPVSKIGKPNQYSSGCFYKDVVKCLDELPSVTQKYGKWKVVSDVYGDNAYICECSECKDTVWVYKDANRKWNYCPSCGAKMQESEE